VSDLRGLVGLAVILAFAFAVSNNRARVPWRTVLVGLALQVAIALLVLRWSTSPTRRSRGSWLPESGR
jgi:CNT family concentrative nucleoside transporter